MRVTGDPWHGLAAGTVAARATVVTAVASGTVAPSVTTGTFGGGKVWRKQSRKK
jgi:hypothetical protein